jgi:hypothetical protein
MTTDIKTYGIPPSLLESIASCIKGMELGHKANSPEVINTMWASLCRSVHMAAGLPEHIQLPLIIENTETEDQ